MATTTASDGSRKVEPDAKKGLQHLQTSIEDALSLQSEGKSDKAIKKWRAVAEDAKKGKDDDLAAIAYCSIGSLLVQNKRWEKGILNFDRAISLNLSETERR